MIYIVLPQAYRNIVPTLLSQVITTLRTPLSGQYRRYRADEQGKNPVECGKPIQRHWLHQCSDVFVLFGFAAMIYFVINFLLSSLVRYIQKHPGYPRQQPVRLEAVGLTGKTVMVDMACIAARRRLTLWKTILLDFKAVRQLWSIDRAKSFPKSFLWSSMTEISSKPQQAHEPAHTGHQQRGGEYPSCFLQAKISFGHGCGQYQDEIFCVQSNIIRILPKENPALSWEGVPATY
jgi:hypothetical protein